MCCDWIAAAKGDNRRHIRDLAGKHGGKPNDDDRVNLFRFHVPGGFAELGNLTVGRASFESQVSPSI